MRGGTTWLVQPVHEEEAATDPVSPSAKLVSTVANARAPRLTRSVAPERCLVAGGGRGARAWVDGVGTASLLAGRIRRWGDRARRAAHRRGTLDGSHLGSDPPPTLGRTVTTPSGALGPWGDAKSIR